MAPPSTPPRATTTPADAPTKPSKASDSLVEHSTGFAQDWVSDGGFVQDRSDMQSTYSTASAPAVMNSSNASMSDPFTSSNTTNASGSATNASSGTSSAVKYQLSLPGNPPADKDAKDASKDTNAHLVLVNDAGMEDLLEEVMRNPTFHFLQRSCSAEFAIMVGK